jgi:sugar O-acyltransferase (sialic acid O-acetyltransferase NeuD family)
MKTVIFGNGAMARVVFSYARHGMEIAGFTVDDEFCQGDEFCGLKLAPFSRVAATFDPATHVMLMAIGYMEMNALRERKHRQAMALGYAFTSYVHHSVIPHDGVTVEPNTVILDHVSIHPGSRIGSGTFISSNINIGHDCDVGEFCWINSGVAIAGGCRIGRGCVFGVNASVAHGVAIGARNFVGANTQVHRPTGDGEVYLSEAGVLFPLQSENFLRFRNI